MNSQENTNMLLAINPPLNVTAIAISYSEIRINWTSVAGANYYTIYRATEPTGTFAAIGQVAANTYIDVGLTQGTTYYYNVKAFSDTEVSEISNTAITTTLTITPPNNLMAVAQSANEISISWSPSYSLVEGYNLYRSLSKNGPYELISNNNQISYIDSNLSPNTTYFYKVEAFYNALISPQIGPAFATTFNNVTPPRPVCKKICWNDCADMYAVYRKVGLNTEYMYVGRTPFNYYIDCNLDPTLTYYYKIVPIC